MTAERLPRRPETAIDYLESLSDADLTATAIDAINDLCRGKSRWTMTVPPDRRDHDLIFSELVRRFEARVR